MRVVLAWQETPPEKDGVRNVCYDLCFNPDGTQLIAGVGARVLVFDPCEGELLHVLKGHKDAVYAVDYAHNGKRFASGGADKTVIIWTSKAEGILKYTHNDSIQCLAYNPVSQQLASGTATDFGLWSPEQKSVTKHKVPSKVLCIAWTSDGTLLALGLYDGSVSLRDKGGNEQRRFSAAASPAWSIAWSPQEPAILAVGCLNGQLKFFDATGQTVGKDRTLPGDPLCLAFLGSDYLIIGGSDRSVHLHTREGVTLKRMAQRNAWVWVARPQPKANAIAVGCEDGSVAMLRLSFATVHGLHGERYVYRDVVTDVVIQHLVTDQRVRIKCRDYVKKVSVYRDRVAVALPTRVIVYALESGCDEATGMQYRVAAKIQRCLDCNLLIVLAQHVLLCQERQLQLLNYEGVLIRTWLLDAAIRYVKAAGGPPGREGVLIGLKSGDVVKVFADNPFPVPLIKHGVGIRCLDLSSSRRQLALVDEAGVLAVYDLLSKELQFEAKGASSVAWNSAFDDMLCFSGSGTLSIRTSDFPLITQQIQGVAVGFRGSKVFCLQHSAVSAVNVPQSNAMAGYLERGSIAAAYDVACLGVTEADWRALGAAALQSMDLDVAHAAYVRLRCMRNVDMVSRIAAGLAAGTPRRLLLAEVAACQGRFEDAAGLFVAEGQSDKALDMFTSMRMFDEARRWAERASRGVGGVDADGNAVPCVDELIGRQAEWSEETADYQAAVEMYIKARRYDRAIALLERHGWWDRLHEFMRSLDRTADANALRAAIAALRRAGRTDAAKEGLLRLGDVSGLLQLNVDAGRWQDAFLLADTHPALADQAYGPYAQWLAQQDRFDEACAAYARAGQPNRAIAILHALADSAVDERRFGDAAHQHYRLAMAAIMDVRAEGTESVMDSAAYALFAKNYDAAEVYHAHELVHNASVQPFKTVDSSTLFNAARFLLMRLAGQEPPRGVALSEVLLTLADTARAQGALKLARYCYSRLQSLVLPPAMSAEVELAALQMRGQPVTDAEELMPVCYRCAATNVLLNTQGDFCTACSAPFHRSFITFDVLPLVEFELEAGVRDDEVPGLLGQDALTGMRRGDAGRGAVAGRSGGGDVDVLLLDGAGGDTCTGAHDVVNDPSCYEAQAAVPHTPIRLGRAALRRLRPSEVLSRRWPNPALRVQWFRLLDPDTAVVVGPCGHFYEAEEYDAAVLGHGMAPFSRMPVTQVADAAIAQDGSTGAKIARKAHELNEKLAWPSLVP